jgi:hypothetical protein
LRPWFYVFEVGRFGENETDPYGTDQ